MHLVSNVEQPSAAQVLTKFLALVNKNGQTWIDLFAEDAVFESPYNLPILKRLEGKKAIYNLLKNVLVQMPDLRIMWCGWKPEKGRSFATANT